MIRDTMTGPGADDEATGSQIAQARPFAEAFPALAEAMRKASGLTA
ncbi:hypothetical protein H9N28_07205 [Rhodobacter capsulatus]|uniref:Uncharacterized protein n=1 Tax=Rhodobacter capsulatus TaxID=1061 RepID=A0A1G7GZW7_RHOCA|nr:hypothetical protein [Rhodobacter capsulatus]PZX27531.1 hypothetical protein LY44_00907 [Rhodobacter capsulatus]QNR64994.1 hypothetical protein H9N28_07205 [Rhodobacter capsulatus]WER07598.1 hypothetical protein PUH89_09555 [Rhodobacter capsulatus]SDE93631.1 hypothetical protein SAMN04244550_01352 [Rhodobacter capsulatus]